MLVVLVVLLPLLACVVHNKTSLIHLFSIQLPVYYFELDARKKLSVAFGARFGVVSSYSSVRRSRVSFDLIRCSFSRGA